MHFQFTKTSYAVLLTLFFLGGSLAGSIAMAGTDGDEPVTPVRFDADQIDGKNLGPGGRAEAKKRGNPREVIIPQTGDSTTSMLFTGDIISAVVEIPGPAKLRLENTLYDEFIQVQEGTLILTTEATGKSETFVAGDSLVLPKGFSGTWDMPEDTFRELIVVETKTLYEDINAE